MLYDIGSDVQMSFASRSRRFRPHRLRFELAFVRPARKLNLLPKGAIEPRTGRASGQHRSTVRCSRIHQSTLAILDILRAGYHPDYT